MKLKFEVEKHGRTDIRLAILDDDEVLWPYPKSAGDGSAVFDAEDVLSYLADAWASLLLSETWPDIFEDGQEPRSITGLQRAADDHWEQLPGSDEARIGIEQAEIDAFLYRHDLRSMKNGGLLSEFYVLREGSRYKFETGGHVFTSCPYALFVEQLEKLGGFVRELLVTNGTAYERVVARWDARNEGEPIRIASYITGVRAEDLDAQQVPLEPLLSRLKGRSLKDIANDNATPLLAVARSSGKLGPQAIAEMIREFRTLPQGPITELVKRRRALAPIIKDAKTHTEQGIRAAIGIRDWLGVPRHALLDLQNVSDRLEIKVRQHSGLDSRIDGLASAGPEHGPAILLNRNTARRGASDADLERSLRFTWAHELGHLLLDNDEWPAITDAVQQRVPRSIETRANAFAAYLLVLPEVAYQALDDEKPRLVWDEVEPALNKIGDRFKVSRIVLARQVSRGAPFGRERDLDMVFRQNIPYFKHSLHI